MTYDEVSNQINQSIVSVKSLASTSSMLMLAFRWWLGASSSDPEYFLRKNSTVARSPLWKLRNTNTSLTASLTLKFCE